MPAAIGVIFIPIKGIFIFPWLSGCGKPAEKDG
jgi:hypothetical protein